MRAARTDKGVSAVGQVCSLMMILHPPDIIERINANLPPQIRVYGYRRAVKGFDARKACDKRRYEYILPAWMFDPAMQGIIKHGSKNNPTGNSADEEIGVEEGNGGQGNAEAGGAAVAATGGIKGDIIPDFLGSIGDDSLGDAAAELQAEVDDEAAQPHLVETLTTGAEEEDAGAEDADAPYGSDSTFQFDQSCVDKLNRILAQFEGTHNFHNFTVRTASSAPQAKRYILNFKCDGVIEVHGKPWVRMVVIGQSFILHQIRKMVGMALAEFRGTAPQGCLKYALGSLQSVATPMAPDLGLFLDECYYEAYNRRWSLQNEALQLEDWKDEVAVFKNEQLYPALARRDMEEMVNATWLKGLNDANYRFSQWLGRHDAEKAVQKARNEAVNSASKRGVEEIEQDGEDGAVAAAVQEEEPVKKQKVEEKVAAKLNASLLAEYSD